MQRTLQYIVALGEETLRYLVINWKCIIDTYVIMFDDCGFNHDRFLRCSRFQQSLFRGGKIRPKDASWGCPGLAGYGYIGRNGSGDFLGAETAELVC